MNVKKVKILKHKYIIIIKIQDNESGYWYNTDWKYPCNSNKKVDFKYKKLLFNKIEEYNNQKIATKLSFRVIKNNMDYVSPLIITPEIVSNLIKQFT